MQLVVLPIWQLIVSILFYDNIIKYELIFFFFFIMFFIFKYFLFIYFLNMILIIIKMITKEKLLEVVH